MIEISGMLTHKNLSFLSLSIFLSGVSFILFLSLSKPSCKSLSYPLLILLSVDPQHIFFSFCLFSFFSFVKYPSLTCAQMMMTYHNSVVKSLQSSPHFYNLTPIIGKKKSQATWYTRMANNQIQFFNLYLLLHCKIIRTKA